MDNSFESSDDDFVEDGSQDFSKGSEEEESDYDEEEEEDEEGDSSSLLEDDSEIEFRVPGEEYLTGEKGPLSSLQQQEAVAMVMESSLLSTTPETDFNFDLGTVLASDPHPLNLADYKKNKKKEIDRGAREGTQLLFNKLFNLPLERLMGAGGAIVRVPRSKTPFPRQKRIPMAKQNTKWERFAKIKGIEKRKKSKKVWDEMSQSWKRRYGYKKANNDLSDWAIMAKSSDTPGEDPWQARKKGKKERVMKGAVQQMRNIDDTQQYLVQKGQGGKKTTNKREKRGGGGGGGGDSSSKTTTKAAFDRALITSKYATASAGKFQKKLSHEPKEKHVFKKRDPVIQKGGASKEREKNMKAIDRIFKKDSILDVDKAISVNKLQNEKRRRMEKSSSTAPPKKKGRKKR